MDQEVFTNRQFINTLLEPEDVTKILRVWDRYLAMKCDRYAPMWVKEGIYEEWLDSPFDRKAWYDAGVIRALPGSIPKGYAKSVGRFVRPIAAEGERMTKKKESNEVIMRDSQKTGLFLSEMNAGVTVVRRRGGASIEKK